MGKEQLGGDLEQMTALEADLKKQGGIVDSMVGDLDSSIRAFEWTGNDADSFKNSGWPQGIRQQLNSAKDMLTTASATVRANIDAQAQASQG